MPMPDKPALTVREALERAIACHRGGQFTEAERLYRAILEAHPTHPDANHNLGILAVGVGNPSAALPFLKAALEANPLTPQFWISYINALLAVGDHRGAREAIIAAERSGLPPTLLSATKEKLKEVRSRRTGRPMPPNQSPTEPSPQEKEHLVGLLHQGRHDDVERVARALTRRFPTHGFGWNVLGAILHLRGQNEAALAPAEKAAALLKGLPEVHNTLAAILKHLGRLEEAEASCRRALAIEPAYPEALSNLGAILHEVSRLDEAEASCRRAIEIRPTFVEPRLNLAKVLQKQGRFAAAETCCREALGIKPDSAEAHNDLGDILRNLGQLESAERSCRRAIQLKPDLAEARANLGNILSDLGRLTEAVTSYEAGIRMVPHYAAAHSNLGGALKSLGRVEEALASYRRALEIKPNLAAAHSNLLFTLNYLAEIPPAEIYAEHQRWDERHGRAGSNSLANTVDRDPSRRLRVGYMSPDLKRHSVAFFFEPLLREHDHTAVEVFCYAEVPRPDRVTSRLQGMADHWRSTVGLSDEAVARQIVDDKIDILVDLAGHTADSRLLVFAYRPAPVQVTWLGYPNTTGLRTMDYRLVDEITDPLGAADLLATEKLVRLETGFLCYAPPEPAPNPSPSPADLNGYVTFGSFNNPAKYSSPTLHTWAALLHRVRDSRLFLKSKMFVEAGGSAAFLARLQAHGIERERVLLRGLDSGMEDHLSQYSRMDIALDPFPYNGTTTTAEAMWMGVPVVTLRGDRHAGRVGASLLSRVGASELIADSQEHYVDIAAGLAGDSRRLAEYRRSMRPRMKESALCDARKFAREVEAGYRKMWRTFCDRDGQQDISNVST